MNEKYRSIFFFFLSMVKIPYVFLFLELLEQASNHHLFLSKFQKCEFSPNKDEIVITDPNNLYSQQLEIKFISESEKVPERLRDLNKRSFLNFPWFFLPNRIKLLKEITDQMNQEFPEFLLIKGGSCVGKSHLALMLYLYYHYQKDTRIIYVPNFHRNYLEHLFCQSFHTFYEEICETPELQIILNLISQSNLPTTSMAFLYDKLFEKARLKKKKIYGEHDQMNSRNLKENESFNFLLKREPDKMILFSISTDEDFMILARKDINSDSTRMFDFPEDEELDEITQEKIIKDYYHLDDQDKIEFLRLKTKANFHFLSEFRESDYYSFEKKTTYFLGI